MTNPMTAARSRENELLPQHCALFVSLQSKKACMVFDEEMFASDELRAVFCEIRDLWGKKRTRDNCTKFIEWSRKMKVNHPKSATLGLRDRITEIAKSKENWKTAKIALALAMEKR